MARTSLRHIVFGLAATGFLTACVEGAGTGAGVTPDGAAPAKVRVGQEIEAPEVFQANESALWDGRPSLGGTWVASPDAVDPERVVMFNPATGKSVTGALFRRERENPGPRLQLSSDAAEALGVLAGQPTEIKVVALRKQEAPEEVVAEVPVVAEVADAEAAGADAVAEDAAATAAAAVAALDAAGAGTAEGTEADPDAAPAEPAPLTWKERRAKAKAERDAKKAADAAAKAEAAAAESGTETDAPDADPTAESGGVAEIVSAPLDARAPDIAADPAPAQPKATETPADPVEATPAPSGAVRPIQIASFSKEDNATRAVQALAKIGITAQIQKSDKAGKIVWGVVANGDATMLQGIKDAGFADAYFLK
jgi:hypothetical protein